MERYRGNSATSRHHHFGLVFATIAAHAVVFYLLATAELWNVGRSAPKSEELTWLILSPVLADRSQEEVVIKRDKKPMPPKSKKLQNKLDEEATPPSAEPLQLGSAITPDVLPKAQDLTGLRSYVWCGLLDEGKALKEGQRPCDKMQWDLQKEPLPERIQTEQEKALARKFDRDLAVANAPILLPCFSSTGGVSISCLVQGTANGFDFNVGSYADSPRASDCDTSQSAAEACAQKYLRQTSLPVNRHR